MPAITFPTEEGEEDFVIEEETWEEVKNTAMDKLPIKPFKREFKSPEQQIQEQLPEEKQDDIVRPTLWIYQYSSLGIDHIAMSLEKEAARLVVQDLDDTEVPEDAEWIITMFRGQENAFFDSIEEVDEAVKEHIIDEKIENAKTE